VPPPPWGSNHVPPVKKSKGPQRKIVLSHPEPVQMIRKSKISGSPARCSELFFSLGLLKKIRLIVLFYRNFWLASLLITLACLGLFWEYGYSIFATLFWFKLATLFIIYRYIRSYKSKEFYYYQNLGVSKMLLWISTLSVDLLVYLTLFSQVNRFR
jgi:hypothetical protein